MSTPTTLLEMAGARLIPPALADCAVVMIDCQREYVDGALPLNGVEAALGEGARLLAAARAAGGVIIHVAHMSPAGAGLFASDGPYSEIKTEVAPRGDEPTVEKTKPNAFAGTDLHDRLEALGKSSLVIGGFMTHMCVSSTVRAALDLGYGCTVVANACATRDLPDGHGCVLRAETLHRTELAALADRFALVVDDSAAF